MRLPALSALIKAGRMPARRGLFRLWGDNDMTPPVQRTALEGVVARNGLIKGAAHGLHVLGKQTGLLLKKANHGCGTRRGQFPVGGELVTVFGGNRTIVGMSYDPYRFGLHALQDLPDLSQDSPALRGDGGPAEFKQHAIHEGDGELFPKFAD